MYEIVINLDHLTGVCNDKPVMLFWTSIKQTYVDGIVFLCVEIAIGRLVTSI